MAVIELGRVIEGAIGDILPFAGTPGGGTDEVQTITIGGTPTGGSFKLGFDGEVTAAIPWNATNATLIAAVDSALEALSGIGTGGVVVAAGTLTAGIGTMTVTFSGGAVTKKAVSTLTVVNNSMTGTGPPTIAVAETTPGVDAAFRGVGKGTIVSDNTNALLYQNTGTAQAPIWTKVGTQT
jgi:hypothetical protein